VDRLWLDKPIALFINDTLGRRQLSGDVDRNRNPDHGDNVNQKINERIVTMPARPDA
jgi:hypothetical protein